MSLSHPVFSSSSLSHPSRTPSTHLQVLSNNISLSLHLPLSLSLTFNPPSLPLSFHPTFLSFSLNFYPPPPRKRQRYTLLLDGGLIKGWAQRTAGSSLCAMITKLYHGIQKAVHHFRFKNVEQHLLLGSGGNQNLRPSCRRPPTRTFHTPVGILRLDAPALVWVRSPNDGNKLGWSWDEVLCPHSRCFGSYFDVIFCMYLVSSGFSFKPTSSSSSSSSTQFS